jgi:hypothetical protein
MLEPSQDPEECGLVEIAAQRGVAPDGGPDREVRQPDSVSGAQVSSHEDEIRVRFHRPFPVVLATTSMASR